MNTENIFSNKNSFKICERCKGSKAVFQCLQCVPFHYFCNNCDTFLHSISIKMNHNRILIDKNYKNDNSNNYINNNNIQDNIISSSNPIIKNNNIANNKNYSQDYINELNNIHLKEKNDLLFKIQSLQDSILRLKNSFGENINEVNKAFEENNKKIKNNKNEELIDENLYKKNIEEKNLEIQKLKEIIEKYKESNNEIINNYNQIEKERKYNEEKMKNEINILNNEIQILKNESFRKDQNLNNITNENLNKMRNEYEMKISKLIIDNDNKLNELKNDNFKQLECLNYELAKLRNDNVTLTRQFNEIQRESLLNEKRDKEEIQKLKNDLDYIKEENNKNIAKLENTEKNLINLQSENIIAMNSLNRQKEELKNNQNEILNLKNNLNLLKEKNEILEKKNKDLQNDYTQLCSHTENINFEYNKKLKNLSYIQDQKNQLEIENNTLRNNMNKYMRPYSFN